MLSKEKKELLILLEQIVGNQCYNANIQNYGPFGEWEGEGRNYRYPIKFINNEKEKVFISYLPLGKKVLFQNDIILSGSYQFGANSLAIMNGLNEIMCFLENRFNINFTDLERKKCDEEKYNTENLLHNFSVGQFVNHSKFGIGKVLNVIGYGDDAKLTIEFRIGTKTLNAGYAKLRDNK